MPSGAMLLDPGLDFVWLEAACAIDFDRGQASSQQQVHFDPADTENIGDLFHLEQFLDPWDRSRFKRLLSVGVASHDRFLSMEHNI